LLECGIKVSAAVLPRCAPLSLRGARPAPSRRWENARGLLALLQFCELTLQSPLSQPRRAHHREGAPLEAPCRISPTRGFLLPTSFLLRSHCSVIVRPCPTPTNSPPPIPATSKSASRLVSQAAAPWRGVRRPRSRLSGRRAPGGASGGVRLRDHAQADPDHRRWRQSGPARLRRLGAVSAGT
jgi:hypothetical protein